MSKPLILFNFELNFLNNCVVNHLGLFISFFHFCQPTCCPSGRACWTDSYLTNSPKQGLEVQRRLPSNKLWRVILLDLAILRSPFFCTFRTSRTLFWTKNFIFLLSVNLTLAVRFKTYDMSNFNLTRYDCVGWWCSTLRLQQYKFQSSYQLS